MRRQAIFFVLPGSELRHTVTLRFGCQLVVSSYKRCFARSLPFVVQGDGEDRLLEADVEGSVRMAATELERVIETAVREAGLGVFDLELPGAGGVLRVFLCRLDGTTAGVGLEDCARVNRKLAELTQLDELIPGHYVIEVSTAGVNRRLRKPEHFSHALGEHVRLVVDSEAYAAAGGAAAGKKTVVKGTVKKCDERTLALADEALKKEITLSLDNIVKARVDFVFA